MVLSVFKMSNLVLFYSKKRGVSAYFSHLKVGTEQTLLISGSLFTGILLVCGISYPVSAGQKQAECPQPKLDRVRLSFSDIWRTERDGCSEEGAGGRAEARHRGPQEPCVVPRSYRQRGAVPCASCRICALWLTWAPGAEWFMPVTPLTRFQAAETLLERDGDFLVRDSSSAPGDYVLTCFWMNGPMHFKIIRVVLRPKMVCVCHRCRLVSLSMFSRGKKFDQNDRNQA